MNRPRTRLTTLHRLVPEVRPAREEIFDAYTAYVSVQRLDELGAQLEFIDVAGAPAIWIGVQANSDLATWCRDASMTTGLDLTYTDCRSAGVLLIGVDQAVYAMSYGAGHLLVPDELKDQRFGLSFLVRRLDSGQIHDLVRRRADARGRTDSTLVLTGAPVWTLGIAENVEIIRRIGGRAKDLKVTFSRGNRPVHVEGSAGLRMRFGVEPTAFLADIRECERVCTEEEPDQALSFVEYVQPVSDPATTSELDSELERLLAGSPDAAEHLIPVVPTSVLKYFGQAHSFTIRIGGARPPAVPTLELAHFLRRTQSQRPGERVTVLRAGHVTLNADDDGDEVLDRAKADKWLEASVSLGPRRFFLMDGDWFEIGADYVRASREAIGRLFPAAPSLDLPPWYLPRGRTEYDYNSDATVRRRGYLCLDRNASVRDPLGARSSLEICDLLGPGNELIHVKRAKGSAPLSHLFSQGLVSAQSLVAGPPLVRERFIDTVAGLPGGRALPADFKPGKVVYAILMENGKTLTPDTLFPFSQATLAHAARILGTYGIDVEVTAIPAA